MNFKVVSIVIVAVCILASSAGAKETPIGEEQEKGNMKVGAVYLQPIEMEPAGLMRPAKDSDIHLEADIHSLKDNPTGFSEGEWVPYLVVKYELVNLQNNKTQKGDLMPMVANDGPHYGDNVKLSGPGKYKLVLSVSGPEEEKHNHFGRHIDKETGVGPWFKPFTLDYEFTFAGTGKKGAY